MKNPTPEKIRARLAARFDRIAIDQLRAEIGRLALRVEHLKSELARQMERADQAENNADFWRDYANNCLGDEGENEQRPQVGITRTGQMVVISGGAA